MAAGPNNRFLGKFRGRVIDNRDPLKIGRITAQVPDVLGEEASTWALPCLPFTGRQAGQYVVPQIGAGVWIEFEQGDPSFPIWTGCWYGDETELPPRARAELPASQPVVIQTPGDHKLVMSDVPGGTGILLEAKGGAYIQIDERGVTIGNGKGASIVLIGDEVNINEGRLIVPKKR
ncbi:baseplate assembly protein [Streptomyces lunaelactis]|uniref:phage baseplate assembly protein V n=1 Tax=Streptomyces lunaelactis TaxID=1535768 RepID=UPI0015854E05|nr:phage baseplate assembly protein V [Streptomyces lunaelactis]NUK07384.1 baseplate assembly protein [Streptomyces lunaelactis]NUK34187.1 baseplate assembly protein [Streptomyces lunaelactis]NUK40089.1 baseplate assembly protein [Streptomyces lunaelactis]NUK56446.1 baseplate assembly protein [Streptomyces lunaelactis]NUK70700.1 baseplate assembly protein [Streptomyces lunaelactis]